MKIIGLLLFAAIVAPCICYINQPGSSQKLKSCTSHTDCPDEDRCLRHFCCPMAQCGKPEYDPRNNPKGEKSDSKPCVSHTDCGVHFCMIGKCRTRTNWGYDDTDEVEENYGIKARPINFDRIPPPKTFKLDPRK